MVTEVHKNNPAVIATAMDPATEGYLLIKMGFVQFTTIETAHSRDSAFSNAKV
jgi:hypothetical protein